MICLDSPGLRRELDVVRSDRRPAVRFRIARFAAFHRRGVLPAAVGAEEGFALGVEAGQLFGAGKVGEVVPALAVFRLVIDHPVLDFHLPGVEISLEVGWSSHASHRQNSTEEKTESLAGFFRRLVTVHCQISRFSPSGTK